MRVVKGEEESVLEVFFVFAGRAARASSEAFLDHGEEKAMKVSLAGSVPHAATGRSEEQELIAFSHSHGLFGLQTLLIIPISHSHPFFVMTCSPKTSAEFAAAAPISAVCNLPLSAIHRSGTNRSCHHQQLALHHFAFRCCRHSCFSAESAAAAS